MLRMHSVCTLALATLLFASVARAHGPYGIGHLATPAEIAGHLAFYRDRAEVTVDPA